jgi:hypothetical protein
MQALPSFLFTFKSQQNFHYEKRFSPTTSIVMLYPNLRERKRKRFDSGLNGAARQSGKF